MIIAIDRNSFNYILKYNSINISNTQLYDIEVDLINLSNPEDLIINEFDRIVPVFEQDHEILILNIDKNKLQFNSIITLFFDSIKSIHPLTTKAKNLISGKLNHNLEIKEPIFENIIKKLKLFRAIKYRECAFNNLSKIYNFTENLDDKFMNDVKKIIIEILNGVNLTDSYLFNLLQYNYTPNEISSGNIEYLEKVGIIAFTYKTKKSDKYTNSPFYIACEKHKNEINSNNYSEGYKKYNDLLLNESDDSKWKESDEALKAIVLGDFINLDLFKISYYFLAIKTILNKNDANLIEINKQIITDLIIDQKTMVHVMYLICFTFSFEQLYVSMHILGKANLLEKKFLDQDIINIKAEIEEELLEIEKSKILLIEEQQAKEAENQKKESIFKFNNNLVDSNDDNITQNEENVKIKSIENEITNMNSSEIDNIQVDNSKNNDEDNNENTEKTVDGDNLIKADTVSEEKDDRTFEESDGFHFSKNDSKIIEQISEPIVIYELIKSQNSIEEYIIDSSGIPDNNPPVNKEREEVKGHTNDLLTVLDFKDFLLNNIKSKDKKKMWSKLLDDNFPNKNEEITYKNLEICLDANIEFRDRLFEAKDKKSIEVFFNSKNNE